MDVVGVLDWVDGDHLTKVVLCPQRCRVQTFADVVEIEISEGLQYQQTNA